MSKLAFHTLTICNFKVFEGEHIFELRRPAGLYYIAGSNLLHPELDSNGVGKSTLWDALYWVLWSKTVRDSRPADSISPWTIKERTSVTLTFSRGKLQYKLVRTRRPNSLLLYTGDSITGENIDQAAIERLIGINEETFSRTIVLGQFGTLFLDLRAEQQSRMFNTSLNLEVWLKASKEASRCRNQGLENLVGHQRIYDDNKGRVTELKVGLRFELEASEKYLSDLKGRRKGLKKDLATKNLQKDRLLQTLNRAQASSQAPRKSNRGDATPAQLLTRSRGAAKAATEALAKGKGDSAVLAERLGGLRRERGEYLKALEGTGACPACGQIAPKDHLKKKLAAANNAYMDVSRQVGVANEQVLTLSKEKEEAEAAHELVTKSYYEIVKWDADVDKLQKELDALTAEENPHDKTLRMIRNRLKACREQRDKAQEAITEQEALVEQYAYWQDAFKEIRLSIIDRVLQELSMAATSHAEVLGLADWRIEFATEKEKSSGEVTAMFHVLIYPDQDEPIRFESYSGGESQRLQLAIATGLSEVLLERAGVEPNIEVYDEPTRGLSPLGIEHLLEYLKERAEELGRAIYVVEHHSLERGMFKDKITIQRDATGAHII